MLRSTARFAIFVFTLLAAFAYADTVTLSNGDRVTGKIVTTEGGKITVKTEFMGDVQIDRKGVQSIETDDLLNVTTESGETIAGAIATEQEKLLVKKEDNSEVAMPLESFEAIRNDEAQAKYEREQERLHNPGLLDFWNITADLGLASAQGNSRTTTFSSGADMVRHTGFDKISLSFAQIYSTQKTTEPHGTTANRVSGGARYDRDITNGLFAFGAASFDFDQFQNLDLRAVLGGGLGWHILKNKNHTWDFTAGGNWNREKFSVMDPVFGDVRSVGEVNLGESSKHQLSDRWKIYQSFYVFPNISDRGEYRFNFDGGTDFRINSMFALTAQVSNRFLSNPIAGNKKNDLLFTTGVKFSFAQK